MVDSLYCHIYRAVSEQLDRCACRLLIILSVEVLEREHEKIGNPQPPSSAPVRKATSPMATRVVGPSGSIGPPAEPSSYGSMRVKNEASGIVPIYALNPYMSKWTIKTRVTAKSEIRTYTNARGVGKVFSFDLLDAENGEIRASCFNRDVDTFYESITVSYRRFGCFSFSFIWLPASSASATAVDSS